MTIFEIQGNVAFHSRFPAFTGMAGLLFVKHCWLILFLWVLEGNKCISLSYISTHYFPISAQHFRSRNFRSCCNPCLEFSRRQPARTCLPSFIVRKHRHQAPFADIRGHCDTGHEPESPEGLSAVVREAEAHVSPRRFWNH